VAVADQFGRTAKRLARALDDALAADGVTMPRARVLMEVAAAGSLRLTAIGAAIGVAQGTASELTDALVREGLLDRRPDPSDRRAILLAATASGRRQAARWKICYEQTAEALFAALTAGQRSDLLQLLAAIEPK
jgi:DNA-binding MarR family transcriptional regulator